MAEDRLREFERAWKESECQQDELAYLQEQVRTGKTLDWGSYSRLAELNVEAAADYLRARLERGELDRERLELAAYCSHEPARLVLGEEAPDAPEDLEEWLEGLEGWGVVCPALGILAAYDAIKQVPVPTLEGFTLERGALPETVIFLLDLVTCPCEAHEDAVLRHRERQLARAAASPGFESLADQAPIARSALWREVGQSVLIVLAELPAAWTDVARVAAEMSASEWALSLPTSGGSNPRLEVAG